VDNIVIFPSKGDSRVAAAGSDAERSLRPRTLRQSLSEERILNEALALIDVAGLDALTTRALGHRLGVDPTAVYRHFRNKDELINALADHILGSSTPPASTDHDGSPRGQLRAACITLHRALLAHPAMTAILVRRPPRGANTWAATERALGLLRQAGYNHRDAARAYQALLYYTLGHAMLEAHYAALEPSQAITELTASRMMYQSLPASEYPNTAAAAPYLYGSLEEQFSYGLDRLLDGLGLGEST
jgi:TetR/AcrR family transcriptional regulator, tetracycline repressor protein